MQFLPRINLSCIISNSSLQYRSRERSFNKFFNFGKVKRIFSLEKWKFFFSVFKFFFVCKQNIFFSLEKQKDFYQQTFVYKHCQRKKTFFAFPKKKFWLFWKKVFCFSEEKILFTFPKLKNERSRLLCYREGPPRSSLSYFCY